jgi:hypothetical protein
VLKVKTNSQPVDLTALNSIGFKLFSKTFPKGQISIPITKPLIPDPEINSYILFVTYDDPFPIFSCGGTLNILSPKHQDFESCT